MSTVAALQVVSPFSSGSGARDTALRTLARTTERLVALDAHPPGDVAAAFHRVVALVHDFCAALMDAETAGVTADAIRDATQVARRLHGGSPFVRRLQEWPRGYPGDFETIEWLWRSANGAMPGTLGFALEAYALTSAVAQQHRNKVLFQAECIRETMAHKPDCRILSLACGSSPDIRSILPVVTPTASFVLCDGDQDALDFSREALAPLGNQCLFVRGMVPRVLGRVAAHGPFDLVYAGGLFDYLPDRLATRTLAIANRTLVASGGQLVFTNIAAGNPFRVWLEYLANWTLIERSDADIRRLCVDAGLDAPWVEREATGLALLATATKR
jgi:extracellular factor (EF) 3-hydroxypalmitic acid methyl ester biosynthesis protein